MITGWFFYFNAVEPVHLVKRYDQRQSAIVTGIEQPNVISKYKLYMGGVDLLDDDLANLRPTIKCKKWYFPIVVNYFRLLVVAA